MSVLPGFVNLAGLNHNMIIGLKGAVQTYFENIEIKAKLTFK